MIEISMDISREAELVILAFLYGALLTAMYDVFRILRRLKRHSVMAVALEDLLYWSGCTVLLFGILYEKSNGMLRIFFISGVVIGMLIYDRIISPYTMKFTVWIIRRLCAVMAGIIRFLGRPFLIAGKKGEKILTDCQIRRRRFCRFWSRELKKICRVFRISVCKQ